MTKTVNAALNMKTPVATHERGDRRAIPQTPCPEVQPEPSRVPNPTSRPAKIIQGQASGSSTCH